MQIFSTQPLIIKIYQDLLQKSGLKFLINYEEITKLIKKLESKHQYNINLCNYSDAYIVVKGTITIVRPNNAKRNKSVVFKNNAPFINRILKIDGIKIDHAEDLDVVMPMCNLLDYSKNYRKITGRFLELLQR